MIMLNKVTKLRSETGNLLTEEDIQEHIDAQNNEGWRLLSIDNLSGWYRFFWEKESE